MKMVDEIKEEEKMKQLLSKVAAAEKEDAKIEDKSDEKSEDTNEQE